MIEHASSTFSGKYDDKARFDALSLIVDHCLASPKHDPDFLLYVFEFQLLEQVTASTFYDSSLLLIYICIQQLEECIFNEVDLRAFTHSYLENLLELHQFGLSEKSIPLMKELVSIMSLREVNFFLISVFFRVHFFFFLSLFYVCIFFFPSFFPTMQV